VGRVVVGISGWNYPPWRGNFYPKKLPHKLELAYASRRFNALEVNGTFYSLKRPSTFATWYAQSPEGFVFTLKGPRFLTHMKRLIDPRVPLANFFASGPLLLEEKLGPILWQLPANFRFEPERFQRFLELLPRDTFAAAQLARDHDARLKGRVHLEAAVSRPIRHALEFRHESFLVKPFFELLRDHGVAVVVADVAGKFPVSQDVTTDWVYVRLHGSRQLYVSGYSPPEIDAWATRVEAWRDGGTPADARLLAASVTPVVNDRDVYVFFDNTDVKLRAPIDARRMAKRLGVAPSETARQILKSLASRRAARS
jgi:uncharacterized protein YecE (DUF72 family)